MNNEYLDFVIALQQLYLEQCDIETILSAIDGRTSWIGTGRQEIYKDFADAENALTLGAREYSGGFKVINSWYETLEVAENVCITYGEFWATPNNPDAGVADLHYRISAVCNKTEDGIKLLHLHASTPDNDQESNEYYAKSQAKLDNQTLRLRYEQTTKDLRSRSRELEVLTENIPGGVHQCRNDPYFTMVNMSSGFLDMFGYTCDDIENIFDNRYMQMICEEDRAAVAALTAEQLSHGKTLELEYRVRCKNGNIMWVLDRGRLVMGDDGTQFFFCMMMDITKRKAEDEILRLALERHNVIMDQASDVIFEWDIRVDSLDFSSNWIKRFGYPPITANISKALPVSDIICPDDMSSFVKIMSDTAAGVPYSETEFRIRNASGEYTWCRIRATTQFDTDNHPIKAVGVIVDIEDEKNRNILLQEAAQRDSLTQLFNKSTTKARVEKLLSSKNEGTLHALMIIDVDNFKNINDTFGHQCGDSVLSNMARSLKNLFRSSDVVGRIGGDEFLVFIGNIYSQELVSGKAKEIVQIFNATSKDIVGDISCSVGISLYPQDGTNYTSLYRCADKALYNVKSDGKASYAFYNKNMSADLSYFSSSTAISGKIDSDDNPLNQELIQHIFQLLYEANNLDVAIDHILHLVGSAYKVSRAYIFENSEDNSSCCNTFEWCEDGIEPQKELLQHLSYEDDLNGVFDLYDEGGIFYCQDINVLPPHLHDILDAQGVVSVLQCLIKDNGNVRGYIGFDECTNNRYWTKEQTNTLSNVANLVSTFLIKHRLSQQLAKLKQSGHNTDC